MVGGERGGSHDRTASGIHRLRYASDASGTSRATHRVSKKHEEEEHIYTVGERKAETPLVRRSDAGRSSQEALVTMVFFYVMCLVCVRQCL